MRLLHTASRFVFSSQTCQHFDWRSGHKFQCLVEKANTTEKAIVNQGRPANGNVNVHFFIKIKKIKYIFHL